MPQPLLPTCAAAAATLVAVLAALPGPVHAQSSPDTVAPFYRGYAFGGIARDGNFSFDDADSSSVDYANNFAPQPLVRVAGTRQAEGATMSYDGWSTYSGYYAARSYATMTVNNAQADQDYYVVAGQGTTTVARFFTAEAAAARATFTWHVSGTSTHPSIGGVAPPSGGWADGRVDFFATTEGGRSWFDLFNGGFQDTLFEYGPGTYSYTLPVTALGDPIYLHFWTSAFTQMQSGQFAQGDDFTLTANFANTVVLEQVTLADEAGNAIGEWQMEDAETGELLFDQSGRITDVAPPPAIPEPGTWALMASGLALLVGRARRLRPRTA
jgi:hypothetical protein